MICALLLGRGGSSGFPGKNTYSVLGRPLMSYPLIAAKKSKLVDRLYVSTDSAEIKNIGAEYGAEYIARPSALCTDAALGEDAYKHGYEVISDRLKEEKRSIELMVLLFANAPTVSADLIDTGIRALRKDPKLDSAVTVSLYNMWSPLRARKLGKDGCLHPFVPFESYGDPKTLNCDRDSQGDALFADMGLSVVRPRCLKNMEEGLLPQKWMGQHIYPIENWGGLDVDYEWQLPQAIFWLEAHGIKP